MSSVVCRFQNLTSLLANWTDCNLRLDWSKISKIPTSSIFDPDQHPIKAKIIPGGFEKSPHQFLACN
jgi:hypothetical protein